MFMRSVCVCVGGLSSDVGPVFSSESSRIQLLEFGGCWRMQYACPYVIPPLPSIVWTIAACAPGGSIDVICSLLLPGSIGWLGGLWIWYGASWLAGLFACHPFSIIQTSMAVVEKFPELGV